MMTKAKFRSEEKTQDLHAICVDDSDIINCTESEIKELLDEGADASDYAIGVFYEYEKYSIVRLLIATQIERKDLESLGEDDE